MTSDTRSRKSTRFPAIMNFMLWGSGNLYLHSGSINLIALILHIYLYFLIIVTFAIIFFLPSIVFGSVIVYALLILPIIVILGSLFFSFTTGLKKMESVRSEISAQSTAREVEISEASGESRKFCINCGIGIPISAKYCSACGSMQE